MTMNFGDEVIRCSSLSMTMMTLRRTDPKDKFSMKEEKHEIQVSMMSKGEIYNAFDFVVLRRDILRLVDT
ncbi:hypothetical protein [Candidatus Nitrosocosmicus hydrocola]|uniref:hypothetical protein n=1 Tax=Candidatus Nitrosocosmicus hydrocola TaxID=1826872 RepID=UPI0013723BBB|nr:hypothetical protein [Candidatus Nitrosocosmicus hydrocola]